MNAPSEHAVFDHLNIGFFKCQISPRKKILQVSKAFSKITGFLSKEEWDKCSFDSLFAVEKERDELYALLSKRGRVNLFKTVWLTRQARAVPVVISACLRIQKKMRIIEGIVQEAEASERPAKGDFKKEEINGLQQILDSIPDAIYFKDRKNRITRVNKFYAKGFGGRLEKILGKTDYDFFPKDQARKMFADDNAILNTGKPIVGKVERSLLPNGTWNQVITTKIPLFNDLGRIVGTMGITRDMTAYANIERERYLTVLKALSVLNKALEMRDPYTQAHARDVAIISGMIGQALNFDEEKLLRLKISAELHDLGKISVPLDILIKPGQLSDLEYSLIKEHTTRCYELIKDIEFPFPLAEIIYQHHERIDGSGYPRGLKGKKILEEAKILAVSDVLESMTMHRPYRPALGIKKAMQELRQGKGIKYDESIVDIAIKLIRKNNGQPFWAEVQEQSSLGISVMAKG